MDPLGARAAPRPPRRAREARCAPWRSVAEESVGVALGGRGVPENVTSESSRAASAGPIPLTRLRFASEPKGPRFSRSATIRRAITGPTPGSASSCAAVAISTSTLARGNVGAALPLGARAALPESSPDKLSGSARRRPRARRGLFLPFPCFARRAESTAASWPSSARASAAGTASIVPTARNARTEAPRRPTLARKRSAFFSAGVGMSGV